VRRFELLFDVEDMAQIDLERRNDCTRAVASPSMTFM